MGWCDDDQYCDDGENLRRIVHRRGRVLPGRRSAVREQELGAQLGRVGAGSIIVDTGDRTLAIAALSGKKGERAVVDALRAAPARVGLSRVVTAERLMSAVHEARKALAATHADPEHLLVRSA